VQRTYSYTNNNAHYQNTSLSQPCASCGGISASAITYDSHGNATSIKDFRSSTTNYTFDLTRNLETLRVEADMRIVQTRWTRFGAFRPKLPSWRRAAKDHDIQLRRVRQSHRKSITAPANDGTSNTVTAVELTPTYGRVPAATDPDNHTTTTTYCADNDSDLGKRGNVATITNATGHVTQITAYDGNGGHCRSPTRTGSLRR
jgi:hypothetical protein